MTMEVYIIIIPPGRVALGDKAYITASGQLNQSAMFLVSTVMLQWLFLVHVCGNLQDV